MLSGAKACKSCRSRQELSNEYLVFTCKIWRRYSRERASQSLQKISQKLEKQLEKNIAAGRVAARDHHEADRDGEELVLRLRALAGRVADRRPQDDEAQHEPMDGIGIRLAKLPNFCKLFLQFFGGLVLGCIKTKFCKKICVRPHFSNSTRCAHFYTAQIFQNSAK